MEWSGRRYCVVVSLLPERVCHRLLWAIGDALLPDLFLRHTQQSLQRRFRGQRFRCCDTVLRPWGTFQTLLVLCSGILLLCFRSALYYRELLQVEKPLREEALDHLASRLLLLGGFGHLWVFYLIAAFFPLRTLHSPLNRDLGSMAAYSNCSLQPPGRSHQTHCPGPCACCCPWSPPPSCWRCWCASGAWASHRGPSARTSSCCRRRCCPWWPLLRPGRGR